MQKEQNTFNPLEVYKSPMIGRCGTYRLPLLEDSDKLISINPRVDIDNIINEIDKNLENIAKKIVQKEINMEQDYLIRQEKEQFLSNLDSIEQHQPNWHQWGIITHTRNFIKMYNDEIKQYLKSWNLHNKIEKYMAKEIDGISKSKLINLAILLHDIGKFQKNYNIKNNQVFYNFNKHEQYSKNIILGDLYFLLNKHYKLTDTQIEYIAMCAKYHFELGFIRAFAKESKYGYSIEYAKSVEFRENVFSMLSRFRDYKIEVGLLFLADSFAKTDIAYNNREDSEILKELKDRNLNVKLINAVKQKPINIEIAKSYLSVVL